MPETATGHDTPADVMQAAALARAVLPSMSSEDLQKALHECLCTTDEVIEGVFEDVVIHEAMNDCLREQDRKAMKEHLASKHKAKGKRMAHTKHIQAFLEQDAETAKKRRPQKN